MNEKYAFPILGTKEYVPFDLVKEHEVQALKNHGGQTVERLAERGGLTYQELACVLLNHPFNEKLSEVEAKLAINLIKDKWSFKEDKHCLRPCIVLSPADKPEVKMKAYFHKWVDKSNIYAPSPMVGGHPGGTVSYTVGLVEYLDGKMAEWTPEHIQFMDREVTNNEAK